MACMVLQRTTHCPDHGARRDGCPRELIEGATVATHGPLFAWGIAQRRALEAPDPVAFLDLNPVAQIAGNHISDRPTANDISGADGYAVGGGVVGVRAAGDDTESEVETG